MANKYGVQNVVNGEENRHASMTQAAYLKERVDGQQKWHSVKSSKYKWWYFILQSISIIGAATIPVISLSSSSEHNVRIAVALLGASAAIAVSASNLFQCRELWVRYRSTAEALKHEKYLYLTGSAPFTDRDSFSLFVNRVESILANQNSGWIDTVRNMVSGTKDEQDKRASRQQPTTQNTDA